MAESNVPARSTTNMLSLAPLGLAVVPALMKFAATDESVHEARRSAAATIVEQCIQSDEAPVHEKYRGVGDVIAHLDNGTRVQVLRKRTTWREVAFPLDGAAETGWVTGTHLRDCADEEPEKPSAESGGRPTNSSGAGSLAPRNTPAATTGGSPNATPGSCGTGQMSVKFYDVGQGLSALVSLPDGRRVLVDSGDQGDRRGCAACKEWSERFLTGLRADVPDKKVSMLWITHQHSDHAGNAPIILREFKVENLVDNGTNLDNGIIKKTHAAAEEKHVPIRIVDPDHRGSPVPSSGDVKITPIVPAHWVANCEDDPNDCSIGLRVDYCQSSVVFTGDAEEDEEDAFDAGGPVTLLQVGHHGSDTSSGEKWLAQTQPKYAVVSSADPGEGTNKTYCHPRLSTVEALSQHVGGQKTKRITAFDANVKCKEATDNNWQTVAVSDHIWFTTRDGDVTLFTNGDGTFHP